MAFEPFDLGRVMQTAESIKGMRREAETDKMRELYLNTQIQGAQQNQQLQRQEADTETQARQARSHYLAAQAVESAADPVAAAREFAPEMIAAFEQQHGPGTFQSLPPEVVKQIAGMGKEKSAAAAGINLRPSPEMQAQQQFAREMDQTNFGQQKAMDATNFEQQKQLVQMQQQMTPYQRATLEAQQRGVANKPPNGYRFTPEGNLQYIPGGPEDPTVKKNAGQQSLSGAYTTYQAAREGLLQGLGGADETWTGTGAIAGRLPAVSPAQQIAEGSVAAMAPVLKSIFRQAGEGTFTDKDQELLMRMVPTRADEPEARKAKLDNIDAIIRAKLGIDATGGPQQAGQQTPIKIQGDDDYARLPSGSQYIAPDGSTRTKR